MIGSLRRAFAAVALVVTLAAPAFAQDAPTAPTTPEGWRDLALSDLAAARDILTAQTPIPFDRDNPTYQA